MNRFHQPFHNSDCSLRNISYIIFYSALIVSLSFSSSSSIVCVTSYTIIPSLQPLSRNVERSSYKFHPNQMQPIENRCGYAINRSHVRLRSGNIIGDSEPDSDAIESIDGEYGDIKKNRLKRFDPFDDGVGDMPDFVFEEEEDDDNSTEIEEQEVIQPSFNSEESQYFDIVDGDEDEVIMDDLDEKVDFYYDPVRNKMIERRLTEKQKAKIRKQRAALKAYQEWKEQQKLEKLRIKEERERKRKERIEKRMQLRYEIEQRKEERNALKREVMLKQAHIRAQEHLDIDMNGDAALSKNNGTMASLVYQELVDFYQREQIELDEMRVEALKESKMFITNRIASTMSSASPENIEIDELPQETNTSNEFINEVMLQRDRLFERKLLVSDLAFSDERCIDEELRKLTDDDLRRVLRIRGYSEEINDINRDLLKMKLLQSYDTRPAYN